MQGRFAWREWIRGRTAAMLACLMLLSCHAATLLAGERPPTSSSSANQDELEQILDRWEHAVGELECLEANFVLWRYDSVFGDSSRSEGRLYYEKPDGLCVHTRRDKDAMTLSEALIWNDKGLIVRDAPTNQFRLWFSKEELAEAREKCRKVKRRSFWEVLRGEWVVDIQAVLSSPQSVFPALVEKDADFRERFEWSLGNLGERTLLVGKPNRRLDKNDFERIRVIIDPRTGLPFALEREFAGGKERGSLILYNIRLNHPPEDREALLNPELGQIENGK